MTAIKRLLLAAAIIAAWAMLTSKMNAREARAETMPPAQPLMVLGYPLESLECGTWIAKCGAGERCRARPTCAADLRRRQR